MIAEGGNLVLRAPIPERYRSIGQAHENTMAIVTKPERASVLLGEHFSKLTCAQALAQLSVADVPVAPVRTLPEVLSDEHYYTRGTLGPMRHSQLDAPVAGKVAVGAVVMQTLEAARDALDAEPLECPEDVSAETSNDVGLLASDRIGTHTTRRGQMLFL